MGGGKGLVAEVGFVLQGKGEFTVGIVRGGGDGVVEPLEVIAKGEEPLVELPHDLGGGGGVLAGDGVFRLDGRTRSEFVRGIIEVVHVGVEVYWFRVGFGVRFGFYCWRGRRGLVKLDRRRAGVLGRRGVRQHFIFVGGR